MGATVLQGADSGLYDADRVLTATLVQEGLVIVRE